MTDFEHYIAETLSGGSPAWSDDWPADEFVRTCQVHGAGALIADLVQRHSIDLPKQVCDPLFDTLEAHKVYELLHADQLVQLLARLESDNIEHLLLKGTALAYSVYSHPWLRSRGDTDLIIDDEDRRAVQAVMAEFNFEQKVSSSVELLQYQQAYTKSDRFGYTFMMDVHWRVSNLQVFALAFPWEELNQNSVDLPCLHGSARTLDNVYQLLHLCLHRVGHLNTLDYGDELTARGDRLLWLYDIFLVCQRLSEADWKRFGEISRQKQLCAVMLDTLEAADEFFSVNIPEADRKVLAGHGSTEVSHRLLTGSRFQGLLTDFLALPGWGQRAQLLREHLLPPGSYILMKYGKQSGWWLPLLYIRRLIGFRF
ncbi:MAG: hypothetical protein HOC70_10045 [Gammaproteobacteria bacterium]|jgi:hypothetical protein|nr:hypothetical protein [Gammaproteobacteria bacterium]MBT4493574.1 hypothetical protein [Gammaproteobacteria bacterium]MBT7371599.1 hypothetical protein [Gammaproteobacteria bacterium]